jgi:hypothetical protein
MKNFLAGIPWGIGAFNPALTIAILTGFFLLAAAIIFLARAAALRRRFKNAAASGTLFPLWVSAQKHRALQKLFVTWARETGENESIRRLAASCRGEDFESGGVFFDPEKQGDLLREFTGDSEWQVRYFAYRMLLRNQNPRTARTLEDGLSDSHPLIRKTLALHFHGEDREKFYGLLWDKLIHDPVYEVRKSAKERITKDFSGLYDPPEASFLSAAEMAHLLELADVNIQGDRNLALSCLEGDNRELIFPAAVFLDQCGVLDRLLSENSLDDPGAIDRNVRLLGKALEVHVSGFISRINLYMPAEWPPDQVKRRRAAALFTAARLLSGRGGSRENINRLAEETFAFFADEKPEKD